MYTILCLKRLVNNTHGYYMDHIIYNGVRVLIKFKQDGGRSVYNNKIHKSATISAETEGEPAKKKNVAK